MIEEKVIQPESVTPAEQPVAGTDVQQPAAPNLDALKVEYEQQIAALKAANAETEEKFKGIKGKLDDVYKKADVERKQKLEDQGQWKDLWQEANKTAQTQTDEIGTLKTQLEDLKRSNEQESTRTAALAAISNAGAINAEQALSLLQGKLQRNSEGRVVVLNGGVEQEISTYLTNLKNPGSGWEHHFKPTTAAGMGAKPTPASNVAPGQANPWKEGSINITRQMALEANEPDLAAVLKKEASS